MKKTLAIILAMLMLLGLAACGTANDTKGTSDKGNGDGSVDMSKYPSDFSKWTSKDLSDYFTAAGVFEKEDWKYTQDHATYYPGTAVNDCVGYMDDAGLVMIGIFTIDASNADTKEEDVTAFLNFVKEKHTFPEDLGFLPVDHLVGNVIFWYGMTTDEDVYNAMDKAYNDLVAALKLTPEF